jgi:hypothetical protein
MSKQTTEELLQERGKRYGSFSSFSEISQSLKNKVYVDLKLDKNRKEDNMVILEGLDMIMHKIARVLNGDPYYDDNWKDIAGYAKLVADQLNKDKV